MRIAENLNSYYDDLANIPFPENKVRELLPEISSFCEELGQAISVGWPAILMAMIPYGALALGKASAKMTEYLDVIPTTWVAIIGSPGDGKSLILAQLKDALCRIEKARYEHAKKLAVDDEARSSESAKRRKVEVEKPNMSWDVGSLMGLGPRLEKNDGSVIGILDEGRQFLQKALSGGVGGGADILNKLYDGNRFENCVLTQSSQFFIEKPRVPIVLAMHLDDVFDVFAEGDPAGVLHRFEVAHVPPVLNKMCDYHKTLRKDVTMKKMADIFHIIAKTYDPQFGPQLVQENLYSTERNWVYTLCRSKSSAHFYILARSFLFLFMLCGHLNTCDDDHRAIEVVGGHGKTLRCSRTQIQLPWRPLSRRLQWQKYVILPIWIKTPGFRGSTIGLGGRIWKNYNCAQIRQERHNRVIIIPRTPRRQGSYRPDIRQLC